MEFNPLSMDDIGYFLYMQEQEEREKESLRRSAHGVATEEDTEQEQRQ